MKTSTNPSGCLAAAIFGLLLVARLTATADNQYWNPTTTAKAAGSNDWSTSVGAWAPTSAGTTTPAPWVNGNDAWFNLNTGVNHATVNGVSAGLLYFQDGTFTFWPGTGPLTLAGPLTNINNLVTFNADVALAANQNWEIRRTTTVNGTLTGPYTLKKTGGSYLVLSNENNNIAGLFLDSHYVQAYGGGNTVGGPGVALTMGSPAQTTIAKLDLYPLGGQSETSWAIGPVTANGFGEIGFKSTSDATTNRVAFGDLGRTNRGVLSLRQEANNFEVRQNVTFSNANEVVVNGMLPPWVATQRSADFLAYDGLVKSIVYKTTAPDTWTATDVVNNTSTRTL
ncbi:MAG: hypothetical protein GX615_00415, partial [Lentisphaerae bacterium]|nr:hypothetical protein [Lentisphaerota bacterium]